VVKLKSNLMKKSLFVVGVLFVGLMTKTQNVSAQAFEEGVSVVQLGYGFPNLGKSLLTSGTEDGDYKAFGIGPIHARFEYGITDRYGIGVSINMVSFGAKWTSEGYTYDSNGFMTGTTTYDHKDKIGSWNILIRFNRHWDVNDKVDIYGGFGLGYNSWKWSHETNDPDYSDDSFSFPIPVGYEATVGLRYYFTDNIGAYIEGGWSKSLLQAGIAMKF